MARLGQQKKKRRMHVLRLVAFMQNGAVQMKLAEGYYHLEDCSHQKLAYSQGCRGSWRP